jgi:energy-coupling factor transporter ATP-binding protein EcfA2
VRLMEKLTGGAGVDADVLLERIDAVHRFLRAVDGRVPEGELVGARTIVERAGGRLKLSRDHSVVALAGSTGSGKSSLFNALARMNLSPVGVRRPTTGVAYACVWGPVEEANRLLDWVGVLPRHRFMRESALDADDESALHGLILLDLPDFDSVQLSHPVEVDRLLGLVDLIVWVVDPQKYADRALHEGYLNQFGAHRDVTVVLLNQADLLRGDDRDKVLADLRRLLKEDGLDGVATLASSVRQPDMLVGLRELLEKTVAERQAALRRLGADLDVLAGQLEPLVGPAAAEDEVDRRTVKQLTEALAASAGVPAVAAATAGAYRHRAIGVVGWPPLRGLRKLRPDPLRRLHLDTAAPLAAASLPETDAGSRSAVGISVRTVADRAAGALPPVWHPSLTAAARSRLGDLPDALDRAVAGTDLGVTRPRLWWRAVGVLQWVLTLTALVGLGWLIGGYGVRLLGLPPLDYPLVGVVPVPTLMLLGGLAGGALLSLLARPLLRIGARRAARRAEQRLRASIKEVAREYVVTPVREVLQAYARAREAYSSIRG